MLRQLVSGGGNSFYRCYTIHQFFTMRMKITRGLVTPWTLNSRHLRQSLRLCIYNEHPQQAKSH